MINNLAVKFAVLAAIAVLIQFPAEASEILLAQSNAQNAPATSQPKGLRKEFLQGLIDDLNKKSKENRAAEKTEKPVLGKYKSLGIRNANSPNGQVSTTDNVEVTRRRLRSIIARIKAAKDRVLAGKGSADSERELRELRAELIAITKGKPYKNNANDIDRENASALAQPAKSIKIKYSELDKTKLIALAKSGNPGAQYELARRLEFGNPGIAKDVKNSFLWEMEAAKKGHALAQYGVSLKYTFGKGVEVNNENALYWLRKSAERGYVAAQYIMFETYHAGVEVKKNPVEAAFWAVKAYEQKDKLSKEMREKLQRIYKFEQAKPKLQPLSVIVPDSPTLGKSKGLLPSSLQQGKLATKKGRRSVEEVAKEMSAIQEKIKARLAKIQAGDKSAEGKRETARLVKRVKELNEEFEFAFAMKNIENLGKKVQAVREVSKAYAKGYSRLSKSVWKIKPEELWKRVKKDDRDAQRELAFRYRNGERGFEKDSTASFQWMLKAANKGDPQAQLFTASNYFDGKGVAKSNMLAAQWLLKSAENGYKFAQFQLHQEYDGHWGIGGWKIFRRNTKKAEYWLNKAAAQGFLTAIEHKKVYHSGQ